MIIFYVYFESVEINYIIFWFGVIKILISTVTTIKYINVYYIIR